MFVGVGSLVLGDVGFEDIELDLCTSTFVFTETLQNFTYSYLSSSSQTLKVAGQSVKPRSKAWTLQVSFPMLGHVLHSYLENLEGPTTSDFIPGKTLYTKGSQTLELEQGVNIKAYNTTQQRVEQVGPSNDFPNANPNDTIYVVIENSGSEPRALITFRPDQVFSFVGTIYFNDRIYYLEVPGIQPNNGIEISDGDTPQVSFNVIKLKDKEPYRLYNGIQDNIQEIIINPEDVALQPQVF